MGKTTLACRILEALGGWGAIKISPVRDADRVVASLGSHRPGSDTDLLARAGAARVVWLRAPDDRLGPAIARAMGELADLRGAVVEGNSFARHAPPSRTILVARAGLDEVKDSARSLVAAAHWLVLNRPRGADGLAPATLRGLLVRELDAADPRDPGTIAFLTEVSAWASR